MATTPPLTEMPSESLEASAVILEPPSQPPTTDETGNPSTSTSTPPEILPIDSHRCFVCLVDETDDTLPPDWCTPCTCSLEGHQDCLLAWVTDLESKDKNVKCPQCKAKIQVTERYDSAIYLHNQLNRYFSFCASKALLVFLSSGIIFASSMYGAQAISWFAGPEALLSFILKTPPKKTPPSSPFLWLFLRWGGGAQKQQPLSSVSLYSCAALPLIAPILFVNRIDVGDLFSIPTALVSATLFTCTTEVLTWPPTPERVLALYPALKSSYFSIHRVLSKNLEKRWTEQAAALSLRQRTLSNDIFSTRSDYSSTTPDDSNVAEAGTPPAEDQELQQPQGVGRLLDWDFDIQIDAGGDDDDAIPNGNDNANANGNRNNNNNGRPAGETNGSGRSAVSFIAGTLLFPAVCFGAGEVLRYVLPSRLVSMGRSTPTGMLQERWGRSFVGGCLFVVLKDAFLLYIKYRKTMNQPFRRVQNSAEGMRRRAAASVRG
ncbi:hypothetical protein F5Y16DRAFT_405536 [Xylariaceae sp. FL0255]|nr:hypothetical protein F5Y16DRAFT_405536 [Xylariaceae sp. FL0255]